MRIGVCRVGSPRVSNYVSRPKAEQLVASGRFIFSGKTCVVELLVANPPQFPKFVPQSLPRVEIPGLKFKAPRTARELLATRAGLMIRARMWAKAATVS